MWGNIYKYYSKHRLLLSQDHRFFSKKGKENKRNIMGAHTTRDQKIEIKTLAAIGWSQHRIAQHMGKPRTTVSRIIKLPLSPPKPVSFFKVPIFVVPFP
jgi:hypothetical protein